MPKKKEPKIKEMKIEDIQGADYNPRKIDSKTYDKLKKSIERFGLVTPLVWNKKSKTLIGGHQRLQVMKDLGYEEATVAIVDLDEDKERALNLALNKIGANWDERKLVDVLTDIDEDIIDLTGFDDKEIEYLLELEEREREMIKAQEDDYVPDEPKPDAEEGDIYEIDGHRLICGDSTDPNVWKALLGEEKVDLIVTSPPYNLDIKYGKYSDDKELQDYLDMVQAVFQNANDFMNAGRYVCINIGREWGPLNVPAKYDNVMEDIGLTYFRSVYWEKPLGSARVGSGKSMRNPFPRYYKPAVQTEQISIYSKGEMPKEANVMVKYIKGSEEKREKKEAIPDVMLSKYAGNVWEMHPETTSKHPAPYPVQLPFNCIRFYTFEDEIVVDPFAGAGTTLIAAEQQGRKCRLIEMDPEYVDMILDRYRKFKPNAKIKKVS